MTSHVLDVAALYRSLDERRIRDGVSWRRVSAEVGVSPSTLSRMAVGKSPDADALCSLIIWLGLSLRQFIKPGDGS
jgi:transcriptional regulator with XRE-family HTH domain